MGRLKSVPRHAAINTAHGIATQKGIPNTKVSNDEVMTPPITACPKGALCSAPSLVDKAKGIMPNTMAKVVIKMGRKRTLAAISKASLRPKGASCVPSPLSKPSLARMAKSSNKIAFLVTKPISMITPITENKDKVE